MADNHPYGIEVNLEFSSNPKLYYLYDRPEVGREVRPFNKQHHLRIAGAGVRGSESGANPTLIKLEGPSDAIMQFFAEYLSADPAEGVYKLLYDDGVKG
jgi:hypothetical protein